MKIWKRIVEAFADVGIEGTPTAIARELHMSQPAVRGWKFGETTPSRAHILAIAKKTRFLSGYIEDAELPRKAPKGTPEHPLFDELLDIWAQLNEANQGRLVERATELLSKQNPNTGDSSELQRRSG